MKKYAEVWRTFSGTDKSKTSALVNAINEGSRDISISEIRNLIGVSEEDASVLKASLHFYAHSKLHHPSEFRSEMLLFDKNTLEFAQSFFDEVLNEKGLRALDREYVVRTTIREDENMISGSGHKVDLEEIRDENNDLVGFVPLVRFKISTSAGEVTSGPTFSVTVEGLAETIKIFKEHQKEVLEEIERLKKTLGHLLIFGGDDAK